MSGFGSTQPSIVVIIPTLNRHELLNRLLAELRSVLNPPKLVIVVDSSTKVFSSSDLAKHEMVLHSQVRSAAAQRNQGLKLIEELESSCEYVAFIDDDVEITPQYFASILNTFQRFPKAVGVSGLAIGSFEKRLRVNRWFWKFIGLTGAEGELTRAGVNVPVRTSKVSLEVDWLIGCSVWRYDLIKDLNFEKDFEGQSIFEDVLFSIRASKRGSLVVNPDIKMNHFLSEQSRPSNFDNYRDWVRNRYRLKEVAPERFSVWKYMIANIAMFVSLILKQKPLGAAGVLAGIFRIVLKK